MNPLSTQPKRTPWTLENKLTVVTIAIGVVSIIVAITIPIVQNSLKHDSSPSSARKVVNPALNSSGAMFGYNVEHTHFNPHEHLLSTMNVSHLVPYWIAATRKSIDSSPAVANGVVYVGSDDGNLYAFNASTGATLWSVPAGDQINVSSPTIADGRVYVGSQDGDLYAFDASSGAKPKFGSTGGPIFSSPAVASGIVYVSSNDGKLYAFDAISGATLWSASTGGPIYYSSPAVANGIVYVGSWDNKLYAFNASNGANLWSISTGGILDSSTTVANGVVYIGSEDHKLYTFHLPITTS